MFSLTCTPPNFGAIETLLLWVKYPSLALNNSSNMGGKLINIKCILDAHHSHLLFTAGNNKAQKKLSNFSKSHIS